MSSCKGQRKGSGSSNDACLRSLYKCKKCGNVGCEYGAEGSSSCTNLGFKHGSCVKCGSSDKTSI